jgi:antitoxin HigA-1
MEMYSPAHPGAVLKDIMGKTTVSELARHLDIPRGNLSNIIHGHQNVSAVVAWKLGQAFPNSDARFWMDLQTQYDLAQLRKKKLKPIKPLPIAE